MRFRQLEYFVAVAEELHFTRAAASLSVSQPALSAQIRALEEELGATLLTRTSRRVKLTAFGEFFLDKARLIVEQVDAATYSAFLASGPTFSIVGYGSGGTSLERSIVHAFEEASLGVEVDIVVMNWEDIGKALRNGDVDVGFIGTPPNGRFSSHTDLMILELMPDERVALMRQDHPLAAKTELSVLDLAPYSVVATGGPPDQRDWWCVNPRPDGSPARIVRTARNAGELVEAVAITGDLVITTKTIADTHSHSELRFVPVVDVEPAMISLAWNSAINNPSVHRFVDVARSFVAV